VLLSLYKLKKDIENAIKQYPSLILEEDKGSLFVKGNFIATDKVSRIAIEIYEVLIGFPEKYPFVFPFVIEISEKIPRELNRHVKADNTLCFGNPQDELRSCRRGITLSWFLAEILNPHLCREFVRERKGEYPTGERSHGNKGIWEGYFEDLKTEDKKTVLDELEMILYHKPIGRNANCYCDSGKKYKVCHEKIEPLIVDIGKNYAIKLFELLKKDYENKNEILK
jgi:hypothetical protein